MSLPETPLVIKNKINDWDVLHYEEKDWCDVFREERLRFRKGDKVFREDPYWEQICDEETMTINKFFEVSKPDKRSKHWLYYDYKYMKDILATDSRVVQGVKWKVLGLENVSGEDSAIWIGNQGAHTPCHMDTYGCNVVAQIMGRKLWILVPPTESDSMHPTRVPYEESSIYSSLNFYTPTLKLLNIKGALKIILSPGDILFIPKHWWHYVENLDVAVSVNVWIPLMSDNESRLEEALVRLYVSNMCQMLSENDAKSLLNPNEYELLTDPFKEDNLKLFIEKYRDWIMTTDLHEYKELETFARFVLKNGTKLKSFDETEIRNFVKRKSEWHQYCLEGIPKVSGDPMTITRQLIDSYCHPKVVSSIRNRLVKMQS